ncbi:MAG: uridine monophosphate kinase [Bacteroidota bacterium]
MNYRSIVLKLSGEALAPTDRLGIDQEKLAHYTQELSDAYQTGVQLILVVGGGNLWRGKDAGTLGITTTEGHHMGMLATMINSLALRDALRQSGLPVTLFSRLPMPTLCPAYQVKEALQAVEERHIVMVGGGLGVAHFSTDTAAIATALDLRADICLKGTRVDGVYPKDPALHPEGVPYEQVSLATVWEQKLRVMDMTAISLAQDNELPIIVYNAQKKGTLKKVLEGGREGTLLVADV